MQKLGKHDGWRDFFCILRDKMALSGYCMGKLRRTHAKDRLFSNRWGIQWKRRRSWGMSGLNACHTNRQGKSESGASRLKVGSRKMSAVCQIVLLRVGRTKKNTNLTSLPRKCGGFKMTRPVVLVLIIQLMDCGSGKNSGQAISPHSFKCIPRSRRISTERCREIIAKKKHLRGGRLPSTVK